MVSGMTRATSRIDLKDNIMADQLAALIRRGCLSAYVSEQGASLFVDDLALEVLEGLDPEYDGHHDGHHVWIGGNAYDVY
jgi:hypothetical protein